MKLKMAADQVLKRFSRQIRKEDACRATRLDSAASRSWIAAIHEELIPFEEVARTLSLMRGSVSDFRRWLNASNTELNYRASLQMIRAGQIHELAGIVRSAPFRSARLRCWLKLAGKFWRVVATSSLLGLVRGENALPEVTRVHPNLLFAGGPRRVGGRYTPMD
jgi:hypothetical protein